MRIKFTLTAILAFMSFHFSSAQVECDGTRYIVETFNSIKTADLTYGQNFNPFSNANETLKLDVYEPENDMIAYRPLIVLIHGGSFLYGAKGLSDTEPLGIAFAKKGYVCASINYRLGIQGIPFPGPDSTDAIEEVLRAVQDTKAAVRYFYKDRATSNTFRIDTSRIYLLGCSAGAITAVQYAFLDKPSELPPLIDTTAQGMTGGLEGVSGNPGYSSKIHAVVSLAGALGDTSWMQPGDMPILSMHGTSDGTVPYGSDVIVLTGQWPLLEVDGSQSIHRRAQNLGIENCFYSHINGGHVDYISNAAYLDTTISVVTWWLQGIACNSPTQCHYLTVPVSVDGVHSPSLLRYWPNPAHNLIQLELPAEFENASVRFIDVSGRMHRSWEGLHSGIHPLDISGLASGIYVVQIQSGFNTQNIKIILE